MKDGKNMQGREGSTCSNVYRPLCLTAMECTEDTFKGNSHKHTKTSKNT